MATYNQHPSYDDYTQVAGFGNIMGWGTKPALILIDVCKAYWTAGSPLDITSSPTGGDAPTSMRNLLSAAREGRIPVVWTQVLYTHPEMKDAGLFYSKGKALAVWHKDDKRGLDGWVEGLEPERDDVIVTKQYPSAFFGTSMGSTLNAMGVDTVVICGVSTSGCVVGSACGDRSAEIHNANLFDMHAKFADIVSEEEAIEKLKTGWK